MPITPEQEWTLVACGLVAHADEILEVGEWDQVLRMLDERIGEADAEQWLVMLGDRGALEARFSQLPQLPPVFGEGVLERAWRMALADGNGSAVEEAVHDRIAERLGIPPDRAGAWRREWNERAEKRAELVIGFAAVMANLDARMEPSEAVQFDALLERMPIALGRRLQLADRLHEPPPEAEVVAGLASLPMSDRLAALADLASMVHASSRGTRERDAFLSLARRLAVPLHDAERLLT